MLDKHLIWSVCAIVFALLYCMMTQAAASSFKSSLLFRVLDFEGNAAA